MTPQQRSKVIALAAALAVLYVKDTYIGDARWWNLVMAGLLIALLVIYLYRERGARE